MECLTNKAQVTSGEELTWQRIVEADPKVLCVNAKMTFEPTEYSYIIKTLGMDYKILPVQRRIIGLTETAQGLFDGLSYFLKLSMLWYITEAKDIGLSGRLVNPKNLRGGDIFFKGTHVLPLDALGNRYGNDIEGFSSKARQLGGVRATGGDAACVLYPFPRIPVTLILWKADEEFGSSAQLLFDSTCEIHLPLDVLWSTAMFTLLAMMRK